jgi:hypothetical protein
MNIRQLLFSLVLVVPLTVATTFADDLNITSILGQWQNSVPVAGVTINNVANQGQDTVRWGDSLGSGQSGYNFTPGPNLTPVTLNVPFLLGSFQHVNNPIGGTSLVSIDYLLSFSTNGNPAGLATTFTFLHNETTNAGPCAAGPEGPSLSICDDFVTVSTPLFNQNIVVGPDNFFFNLIGFSKDGGVTTSNGFQSQEQATTSAGLYARVTSTPVGVPEPGVLSLLLTGLGALAFAARRLRKS